MSQVLSLHPAPEAPPSETEPLLIRQGRAVLEELTRLADERARAEEEIRSAFEAGKESAEVQSHDARLRIEMEYRSTVEGAEEEVQTARQQAAARYEANRAAAEKTFAKERGQAAGQGGRDQEANEASFQESRWTAGALFEGTKTKVEGQWQGLQRQLEGYRDTLTGLRQEANRKLGRWADAPPVSAALAPVDDPQRRLKERLADAEALLARSETLPALKLLRGLRFPAVAALVWLLAVAPAAWMSGWYYWLAGGTLAAVIGAACLRAGLGAAARRQVQRIYHPLCQALADAEALTQTCHDQAAAAYKRQLARNQEVHDSSQRQAEEKYERQKAEINARRENDTRRAEEKYRGALAEITSHRDTTLRQAEEKHKRQLAEAEERYESETAAAAETYRRLKEDNETRHRHDWEEMARRWREGLAAAQEVVDQVNRETEHLFPPWSAPFWKDWPAAESVPPVLRFGEFPVALSAIPHGVPQDEGLRHVGPTSFRLPALLACPGHCSMLFLANDEGRAQAEQGLQAVMLRLLTALPPAKVRFTIIDPVGLGQNFAAFMHLADHDELLVASRIWTEQAHIEQRLADLTAHMENVIQKFLRNQFQTIEEYNVHAGEVAEPFRFLVVANFPANFSLEATRRLVSIAASGARCGVHTLVTVDTKQPLPQGFDLMDLRRHSVNLEWKDGRFHWQDPDFGRFPFRLDTPPDADFATQILQVAGKRAKEASRVEVPFEFITPPAEEWWRGDSRRGVRVALGRAGATKRQSLALGQGTAQHVLIAGKTGSGKSTLLHALITNLSLLYSPEEVELYLVDFKEGVEFKAYATHELPHARVVAIESEREFGLSVLQRLEGELKFRGDRFRALGVQDLNAYRQATEHSSLVPAPMSLAKDHGPGTRDPSVMPRILLIVDEFQLFFIEDDKIAQDAALLLDRLVRQGRAFGIHVLLGSQTLGGAYSLARSTIGQMAVRIALQCSEADAHLILSDDNPAARLLSRPGEAIYNDANGLVEGNDFFQVVWLSDEKREGYLRRVGELAGTRNYRPPHPPIVFEGNAPAELAKNHLLESLLTAATWPAAPRVAPAWLGEAMAIKDPTAAGFRRQSGSNLLMIGQFDEAALGITAAALVSLAAQYPAEGPAAARFSVLDGSPVDAPHAGFLEEVAAALPHAAKVSGWRDVPAIVAALAEEVERRQKGPESESPPVFLFIYGLQRFRDLRRQDDDFGFSRRADNAPPNPAKLFAALLRDGPAVGVFTVVWCDTLTNANRALDRQALREFEMRVLFQMNAADSSNLIDSPLAAKLGLHRALFYSEDRGQPEKFRPYGLPSQEWLGWVRGRLDGRGTNHGGHGGHGDEDRVNRMQ